MKMNVIRMISSESRRYELSENDDRSLLIVIEVA